MGGGGGGFWRAVGLLGLSPFSFFPGRVPGLGRAGTKAAPGWDQPGPRLGGADGQPSCSQPGQLPTEPGHAGVVL